MIDRQTDIGCCSTDIKRPTSHWLNKLWMVRFLEIIAIRFSTQNNINKSKHNMSGPCNRLFSNFLKKRLCFKILGMPTHL